MDDILIMKTKTQAVGQYDKQGKLFCAKCRDIISDDSKRIVLSTDVQAELKCSICKKKLNAT